jgi:acetyl esterase/lipase
VTEIPGIAWIQEDYVVTPDYQVPVRIYHPAPDEALPVLIYYHGGGHMSGSVTVYDPICRKLALATKHIVISPEYRVAPECPYPAGVIDAYGVAKYLWRTLDERKLKYQRILSLSGDSAGGTLAATVSGKAQFDPGLHIKRQVLIYPSLDYTMNTESIEQNAVGYMLQKDKIIRYFDSYFTHAENRKAVSPLFWDVTKRMPETLVITAEFCPLRDEGVLYYEKLRAAGLKAEHLHFDDMIHVFINLEDLVPEACRKLYDTIGAFMKK